MNVDRQIAERLRAFCSKRTFAVVLAILAFAFTATHARQSRRAAQDSILERSLKTTTPGGNDCNDNGVPDDVETEVSFSLLPVDAAAAGALVVRTGDIDRDGDADILRVTQGAGGDIAWYENTDGQGSFGPARIVHAASFSYDVRLADIDRDGDLDVLSIGGAAVWFENLDGAGNFGPAQTILSSLVQPRAIRAADLDNDGDLDAIAGYAQLGWAENVDGAGSFVSRGVVDTSPGDVRAVAAADLDGDGLLDVICGDDRAGFVGVISWYANDGDGTFIESATSNIGLAGVRAVEAADLDGDGDADLIGAADEQTALVWYENTDGGGSFVSAQVVFDDPSQQGLGSLAVEDIDGDGDLDLTAAAVSTNRIYWWENLDSLGSFGPAQVVSAALNDTRSVATARIDAGGTVDLVSASFFDGKISWHRNDSADCNANGVPDTCDAESGASADCDGDLVPDECQPDCNDNGTNDACDIDAGGSSDCEPNTIPDECEIDCNGNGIGDACDVAGGSSDDCNVNGIPDECEDCNENGLADSCDLAAGTSTDCDSNGVPDECDPDCNANNVADACDISGGGSGDCNLNGIPDECEPDCDGNGVPDECEQDCNGNGIADGCDLDAGTSQDCDDNGVPDECEEDCNGNGMRDVCDIAGGTSLDCNGNGIPDLCDTELKFTLRDYRWDNFDSPSGTNRVADMDGDGNMDVIVSYAIFEGIRWSRNLGDGVFSETSGICIAGSNGLSPKMPAHIDGDGLVDVVHNDLSGLVWQSGANLCDLTPPVVSDRSRPILSVDLDGDGSQDLLASPTVGLEIVWYPNDGTGSFAGQRRIAVGPSLPQSLATADIDRDGDIDILAGFHGEIGWIENRGGASGFAALRGIPSALSDPQSSRSQLWPADLDGDGDLDVLSTSQIDDALYWNENTDGAGEFGPQQVISSSTFGGASVFALDLDADGRIDVVHSESTGRAWYRNLGGGVFDAPRTIGGDLTSYVPADMDRDGDIDIVLTQASVGVLWSENTSNDCNGNRIPDSCEPDTDGDGITDDCEAAAGDCNANGLPDYLDIFSGAETDCNGNAVPDACENGSANDCDGDGVVDLCQTACLTDCDGDGDGCIDSADSAPSDANLCGDADSDGCDDCSAGSFAPDADGVDTDSDGACDLGDCAPSDPALWAPSGPARWLTHAKQSGFSLLSWSPPAHPGVSAPHYDTLAGVDASNLLGTASCLESNETDRETVVAADPPPGSVSFLLIRVANQCPGGGGSAGFDSAGLPRQTPPCP